MLEVIKKINETPLSPNQYLLLYALHHNVELKNVDIETEKQSLIEKGYLNNDHSLIDTELVSKELEEKAILEQTRRICSYFPPIILPTGLPARGKHSQIKLKLKIFLQTYNYSWTTIYEATERYVNRYREQRYKYMQNASNFILDKNGDSTLATECEILEHDLQTPEETSDLI